MTKHTKPPLGIEPLTIWMENLPKDGLEDHINQRILETEAAIGRYYLFQKENGFEFDPIPGWEKDLRFLRGVKQQMLYF